MGRERKRAKRCISAEMNGENMRRKRASLLLLVVTRFLNAGLVLRTACLVELVTGCVRSNALSPTDDVYPHLLSYIPEHPGISNIILSSGKMG